LGFLPHGLLDMDLQKWASTLLSKLELPALVLRGWVILLEWDGFEVDGEGDI